MEYAQQDWGHTAGLQLQSHGMVIGHLPGKMGQHSWVSGTHWSAANKANRGREWSNRTCGMCGPGLSAVAR